MCDTHTHTHTQTHTYATPCLVLTLSPSLVRHARFFALRRRPVLRHALKHVTSMCVYACVCVCVCVCSNRPYRAYRQGRTRVGITNQIRTNVCVCVSQVVFTVDELSAIKHYEGPGMRLIGFKPRAMLQEHHNVRGHKHRHTHTHTHMLQYACGPVPVHARQYTHTYGFLAEMRRVQVRACVPVFQHVCARACVCVSQITHSSFLRPTEKDIKGSTAVFKGLLDSMARKDVVAVCA